MKTEILIVLLLAGWIGGAHAQYAFVTGATPPPTAQPAPVPSQTCPIKPGHAVGLHCPAPVLVSYPGWGGPQILRPVSTVSYSVLGRSLHDSCLPPPMIYHVPTRNVIYFGRPESRVRNYLNPGYARTQSSVVYFGRGEGIQRGYYFNHCR